MQKKEGIHMKKKWLSLTLALALGLSLLTLPAAAAANATVVKSLEGYNACFDYHVYSDGMMAVEKQGDDYGNTYLDKNGNQFPGGVFSTVKDFSEGLAAVVPNVSNWKDYQGYGYIDKTGKMVIEPSSASPASSTRGWPGSRAARPKSTA